MSKPTIQLTDSELIHYASLSDDPEKRQLAQAADAGRHRWEQSESEADALQERAGELEAALDDLGALKFRKDGRRWPDYNYLQYLARLSKAVNDGRVQLVEDCAACEGPPYDDTRLSGEIDCHKCDGRGVILLPADSDSI